jgi:hypothetical protein
LDWAELVAQIAPLDRIKSLLLPVLSGDPGADRMWVAAEAARNGRKNAGARGRLAEMVAFLPEAGRALGPVAREVVAEALGVVEFPDPPLATLGRELASIEGRGSWMWLAIAASPPGSWDDAALDASVQGLCVQPPAVGADRDLALGCMLPLARATGWSAHDQAKWVIRLARSTAADRSGFNLDLAERYLRGISLRDDGVSRITAITREILELPPDHPAHVVFLERLLGQAWENEVPRQYVEAMETSQLPTEAMARWREVLAGRGAR